jgi:hypothetical protein
VHADVARPVRRHAAKSVPVDHDDLSIVAKRWHVHSGIHGLPNGSRSPALVDAAFRKAEIPLFSREVH